MIRPIRASPRSTPVRRPPLRTNATRSTLQSELASIDANLHNVEAELFSPPFAALRISSGRKWHTRLNTTNATLLQREGVLRSQRKAYGASRIKVRKQLEALLQDLQGVNDTAREDDNASAASLMASAPLLAVRPLTWRSRVYVYNVSLERDFGLTPSQVRAYDSILRNDAAAIKRDMDFGLGEKLIKIRRGVSERTHPDGWLHRFLVKRLGASVTSDPTRADFFFLPVWSYALCTATAKKLDGVAELDMHMQQSTYENCGEMARVLDWLQAQATWRRSFGADHLYIMNYKDRMSRSGRKRQHNKYVRNTSYALVANAIFVSTEDRHAKPERRRGCTSLVVPYYANLRKWGGEAAHDFDAMLRAKTQLISFFGNRRGKKCHLERGACPGERYCCGPDKAGVTRYTIQSSISKANGTVLELGRQTPSSAAFSDANTLLSSVFCPCPLGDTYTSKRLFTVVQALCLPIIVSDGIQLPYDSIGLPWRNFSLQVPERAVLNGTVDIVQFARSVPPARVRQMQAAMWAARPLLTFSARAARAPPDASTMLLEELQQTRACERAVLAERLGSEPCMHGVSFGLEKETARDRLRRRRTMWVADGCKGVFMLYVGGRLCDEHRPAAGQPDRWCERLTCMYTGSWKTSLVESFQRHVRCEFRLRGADW